MANATDVNELVEPLKREVSAPGRFAATFPSSDDRTLVGYLMDAFAAAQIDGYFPSQLVDVDNEEVEPSLSAAGRQLVVIYAAERITTNRIVELKQSVVYEAGPVKYETQNSAAVLTQVLKDLRARRERIVAAAERARGSGGFIMQDMFADRATGVEGAEVGATFYRYELI